MAGASSPIKLFATLLLIGTLVSGLFLYFGDRDKLSDSRDGSTSLNADDSAAQDPTGLESVREDGEVSGSGSDSAASAEEASDAAGLSRSESVSLHDEMLSVDSLPQERRWLSANGSVSIKALESAFEADDFESMIQRLRDEALDNEHATELMDTYSDYLRTEVQRLGGDEFRLDEMACGVRTCVGQVLREAGSEADWISFSRLGLSQDGPPVYLSFDASVPFEGAGPGFDPTAYRFFISIDPDNRSFEIFGGP